MSHWQGVRLVFHVGISSDIVCVLFQAVGGV